MAVTTKTVKGKIENAYGRPLAKLETKQGTPVEGPLSFEGPFTAYGTIEDVRAAGKFPSDVQITKFVTAKSKAEARAVLISNQLDAAGIIKPTPANDPQEALKEIYATLRETGKSHEDARARAVAAIGVDWADEDDEDGE